MMRVAMIPARLGSTRVPKKNLRFLGGKPLLAWVVETVLASKLFDAVIVNTEADEIAECACRYGADVYRRASRLADDDATSEHFVKDFIDHVACDELYQITPTSPFITIKDLQRAVALMEAGARTVLPVKRIQAECLLNEMGVNFTVDAPMIPSQQLRPVLALCNGIFGWNVAWFQRVYAERGSATFGRSGSISTLVLDGDASLDIDTEQDFALAEAILTRRAAGCVKPRYWSPSSYAETDAVEVLQNDRVTGVLDLARFSHPKVNIYDALTSYAGEGAVRVVQMPSSSATIITQMPGGGNRLHYHHDLDEWWLILEGEYEYEIGDVTTHARIGDIVAIPRGTWHRITAVGGRRASRLAVSRDNVEHVYHD